jgi:hypothetical protein
MYSCLLISRHLGREKNKLLLTSACTTSLLELFILQYCVLSIFRIIIHCLLLNMSVCVCFQNMQHLYFNKINCWLLPHQHFRNGLSVSLYHNQSRMYGGMFTYMLMFECCLAQRCWLARKTFEVNNCCMVIENLCLQECGWIILVLGKGQKL